MNLSIIEKEGSSTGKQHVGSSLRCDCRNKRPIVTLPWGPRRWPGKHVAMVSALSLSSEYCLGQALCSVHRICQESARSKSALESTEAQLNQLQLAEELFPKQGYKSENFTAQHFSQPSIPHLACKALTPSTL